MRMRRRLPRVSRPSQFPAEARKTIVRDARRSDLPSILEIYNDAVTNLAATFDIIPQTLAQRETWFSGHGKAHPLIVAERGERVVGYASLSKFRDKPAYSRSSEDSVYVHPDFRGMGIGTLLMKEIIARAVQLGYHTVIAGIVPPNQASVRLHNRFGFKRVGTFKEVGFKFSRWHDVTFYQLFLLEEGATKGGD